MLAASQPRDPASDRNTRAAVLLLILATAAIRIAAGDAMGLGVDESYMVAAGRGLRWGYFDHPPAAWWLAWGAAHLAGSSAAVVVRLPFIALFGLSTWLMHRIGSVLYGPRSGLWAAVLLNIVPVFGVTAGGWVLPDGPLVTALLGALLCLIHALAAEARRADRWWIGAGLCAGLALFSKYSAALSIGGALVFLLTSPAHRRSFRGRGPYLAAVAAFVAFSPVLAWNAENGWASFVFQAGRADAVQFKPLAPLATMAGEALFLLPWIWLPLIVVFVAGLRRGPADGRSWLLCCMAAPPILLFTAISAWSRNAVLFHWASPGYLMLLPMLGDSVARRLSVGDRGTRFWLAGSAAFVAVALAVVATEIRFGWLPLVAEAFPPEKNPEIEALNWASLRPALASRGLLGAMPVAAFNWHDAGKIDYALGGAATVICLNQDGRQYGVDAPLSAFAGRDVLIVARQRDAQRIASHAAEFERIEPLPPPVTIDHAGRPAFALSLFVGRGFRPPQPASSGAT